MRENLYWHQKENQLNIFRGLCANHGYYGHCDIVHGGQNADHFCRN